LLLFDRARALAGAETIAQAWPHLRCIIHGGVKFEPYRRIFQQELGDARISLQECYPCSEGFVAFEDLRYQLLRPIPDHNIYFEFVPLEELQLAQPTRHGLWEVVPGIQYAVVMTTCAGLWAYVVGDTICFEKSHPPLFRFSGRTKYYLSAFGEHLISEEVEQAISHAAQASGTCVLDFHVGPRFPSTAQEPGRHVYLVEGNTPPSSLRLFTQVLDDELCRLNEDYRAHRAAGTGLSNPKVYWLKSGSFTNWMRAQGKLGGQHKVPRMDNTGSVTSNMLDWFLQHDCLLAPGPENAVPNPGPARISR
jgi:hypothetical protein